MNKEKAYERAAKVLFYGSLDEPFAFKKAIHVIREKSDFDQLSCLHQLLENKQKPQIHVHAKGIEEGHLEINKNLRLDYWREFRFNSSAEVFFPTLYKWIGGFSDEEIKELFHLSSGTLTMRYNSGLLKLGNYLIKEVSGE